MLEHVIYKLILTEFKTQEIFAPILGTLINKLVLNISLFTDLQISRETFPVF